MSDLSNIIESAFEERATISPTNSTQEIRDAVNTTISQLNSGELRVAEKIDGQWSVNQWAKKPCF